MSLPYDPQQQFLLPPALQEWLPEGHLAYFISDTVDQFKLDAFHARYAGGGPRNQPFHPVMMVKVLLYVYASGVFSSRKMHEDAAFRVLGAGNVPRHRTICDFRALHLHELADLFVQVAASCRASAAAMISVITGRPQLMRTLRQVCPVLKDRVTCERCKLGPGLRRDDESSAIDHC